MCGGGGGPRARRENPARSPGAARGASGALPAPTRAPSGPRAPPDPGRPGRAGPVGRGPAALVPAPPRPVGGARLAPSLRFPPLPPGERAGMAQPAAPRCLRPAAANPPRRAAPHKEPRPGLPLKAAARLKVSLCAGLRAPAASWTRAAWRATGLRASGPESTPLFISWA